MTTIDCHHNSQQPQEHAAARPAPSYYIDTDRAPLGTGAFGTVYHGLEQRTQTPVAVKLIVKSKLSPSDIATTRRETAMMQKVTPHPHVQRLVDLGEDPTHMYIVLPVVAGGELQQVLDCGERYTEDAARELLRSLLSGIAHMHACGVMHRDIKLDNVLLRPTEDGLPSTDPVLIDFGFATDETRTPGFCGTPYYLPPEVIAAGRDRTRLTSYNNKCDVWSFAVLAFIILNNGVKPFYGASIHECIDAIHANKPAWREQCSPAAQAFVESLLVSDPRKRPTAAQALEHPWLQPRPTEYLGTSVSLPVTEAHDFAASAITEALGMSACSAVDEESIPVCAPPCCGAPSSPRRATHAPVSHATRVC